MSSAVQRNVEVRAYWTALDTYWTRTGQAPHRSTGQLDSALSIALSGVQSGTRTKESRK